MTLRFKKDVVLHPNTPALHRLIAVLELACAKMQRDLTVTCGREAHAPTSAHSRGMALDLRTSDLPESTILTLHDFLRETLGPEFVVLYEVTKMPNGVLRQIATLNPAATANHFHLQVRKGIAQWPIPKTDAVNI